MDILRLPQGQLTFAGTDAYGFQGRSVVSKRFKQLILKRRVRLINFTSNRSRAMFKRLYLLALLLSLPVLAGGAERELPLAADFHADAAQARALKRPILVFFAAESCPYCHAVETLYLAPLHNDDAYTDKVVIRVVRVERQTQLRDFAGRNTTHAAFAQSYGVKLTPVVKLLDANGKELAPALIGYSSPDFYGAYLEQTIEAAIAAAGRASG